MPVSAHDWLARIRALPAEQPLRIMNVCGGHERSISQAGLRSLLPDHITLIPGPGCPVCVCPEQDLYQAIQWSLHEDIILLAFGDMLRVPVNVGKQEARTLEQAKAHGADVRAIASPLEAAAIARANPQSKVVFFVAGFETTCAPVAAMLLEGVPDNLLLLLSGRLTWPAVAMLMQSATPNFDALIAPGHVATIMGAEQWQFVVQQYGMPTAVAGFDATSILAAIYSVLRQGLEGRAFLDNCYPALVRPGGNALAQQQLHQAFTVCDAEWRGIGAIPDSGFALSRQFAKHDARTVLSNEATSRKREGEMPPGCDCANVVLGRIAPNACKLYGSACTPRQPVGPCMVSDEGACRIWWASGIRERAA